MTTSIWLRSVVALGVCLLVPGWAGAANIRINDLADTITITSSEFEGGFTSSVDGESGTFGGTWITFNTATGSATVYFTEGNTNQISDILTVDFSGDQVNHLETISGTFTSDTDGSSLGQLPAGAVSIVEDGSFQEVSALLFGIPAVPSNLTMQVASDVERVPEPSTLLLLGTGIAGLAVQSRRKRAA